MHSIFFAELSVLSAWVSRAQGHHDICPLAQPQHPAHPQPIGCCAQLAKWSRIENVNVDIHSRCFIPILTAYGHLPLPQPVWRRATESEGDLWRAKPLGPETSSD